MDSRLKCKGPGVSLWGRAVPYLAQPVLKSFIPLVTSSWSPLLAPTGQGFRGLLRSFWKGRQRRHPWAGCLAKAASLLPSRWGCRHMSKGCLWTGLRPQPCAQAAGPSGGGGRRGGADTFWGCESCLLMILASLGVSQPRNPSSVWGADEGGDAG